MSSCQRTRGRRPRAVGSCRRHSALTWSNGSRQRPAPPQRLAGGDAEPGELLASGGAALRAGRTVGAAAPARAHRPARRGRRGDPGLRACGPRADPVRGPGRREHRAGPRPRDRWRCTRRRRRRDHVHRRAAGVGRGDRRPRTGPSPSTAQADVADHAELADGEHGQLGVDHRLDHAATASRPAAGSCAAVTTSPPGAPGPAAASRRAGRPRCSVHARRGRRASARPVGPRPGRRRARARARRSDRTTRRRSDGSTATPWRGQGVGQVVVVEQLLHVRRDDRRARPASWPGSLGAEPEPQRPLPRVVAGGSRPP